MISILFEKWWPTAGALLVAGAWLWAGNPFPDRPDGLFGASATVASVFASFLGVSKAIVLTIKGTATYKFLEKAGKTDDLFRYLRAGIFASVTFAALSILGFFIDHKTIILAHHLFKVFCLIWVAGGALALFAYVRITNILFALLKQPEV